MTHFVCCLASRRGEARCGVAGREGDGHHRRPLQAGMASSDGAGALDGAKNSDLHPQPGGDDRPERGYNWNRKPDTGGGGPRAFGCGAQDGPPRLATAMGRRRGDEPGTSLPLRVCGKGVGHTSVQCRTYRLWHHARSAGLKAADISRLARERGTWACRACPATPPATPRGRGPRRPHQDTYRHRHHSHSRQRRGETRP